MLESLRELISAAAKATIALSAALAIMCFYGAIVGSREVPHPTGEERISLESLSRKDVGSIPSTEETELIPSSMLYSLFLKEPPPRVEVASVTPQKEYLKDTPLTSIDHNFAKLAAALRLGENTCGFRHLPQIKELKKVVLIDTEQNMQNIALEPMFMDRYLSAVRLYESRILLEGKTALDEYECDILEKYAYALLEQLVIDTESIPLRNRLLAWTRGGQRGDIFYAIRTYMATNLVPRQSDVECKSEKLTELTSTVPLTVRCGLEWVELSDLPVDKLDSEFQVDQTLLVIQHR